MQNILKYLESKGTEKSLFNPNKLIREKKLSDNNINKNRKYLAFDTSNSLKSKFPLENKRNTLFSITNRNFKNDSSIEMKKTQSYDNYNDFSFHRSGMENKEKNFYF